MEIHVRRVRQGKNSTLSEIYIEDEFMCYGLEDLIREEKVQGITAIPAGRYKLEFRQHGGMHGRYTRLYPDFHRGMLHITKIPNFSYVYIHKGNSHEHTAGCILVGEMVERVYGDYLVVRSEEAYVSLYKRIVGMMARGAVHIVIA